MAAAYATLTRSDFSIRTRKLDADPFRGHLSEGQNTRQFGQEKLIRSHFVLYVVGINKINLKRLQPYTIIKNN